MEKLLPEGGSSRYVYNNDNTLKQLVNRRNATTVLSQHDYSYDRLGNRLTDNSTINGVASKLKYVYDPLCRLNEVRSNDPANTLLESYAYDAFGNRTQQFKAGITSVNVFDNAHQLLETRAETLSGSVSAAYVYDANGNMTQACDGGTVTRECWGQVLPFAFDKTEPPK